MKCVKKMLPECDRSQREAIASSLKTLRNIIPNNKCVKDVSEGVCEAEKVEPGCDPEKIDECENDYDPEDEFSDDDKCL